MPFTRDYIIMESTPAVPAAAAAAAAAVKRNEVEMSLIGSVLPVINVLLINGRKYLEE
jgi:hypothetical protein